MRNNSDFFTSYIDNIKACQSPREAGVFTSSIAPLNIFGYWIPLSFVLDFVFFLLTIERSLDCSTANVIIYFTYPTKMRQHKILTRTLLILSIINFALAAPVAVQGRPEVCLDTNVTRNVAAASQKRSGLDEEGSTNVPGPDHAPPPSPDLRNILSQIPYADSPPHSPTPDYVPIHAPPPSPDLSDILSQIPHVDSPPPTPDSLSPSPESPTESRLPVGSMPVAGSLSPPPPPPPHPSQPGPSDDRFPLSPPLSPSLHPSQLGPSEGRFPSPPGFGFLLPPYPSPHPSQLGPSQGRFPSPSSFPVNSDKLSSTGSTDNRPTPPQSPGVDPDMHYLLNPEPFPTEFWDDVLKGKFKRRISGSDAVNLAQKDISALIFDPLMLVINGVGGAPRFNRIQMLSYGVRECTDGYGRACQSGILGKDT
ncbi:hypothetical protein V8E52_009919 [Russula decolorans]